MKKTISFFFALLFLITPLVFTKYNFELFEYNKMVWVYILTILITAFWIFRSIREKKIIFQKTPLDIPILLFLLSQIISTFTSIDPHTSVWGYYSRSNGGLLSIISYILLFYAFISNFSGDKKQILKFIRITLLGGLLVALYAIPEHFGHSPSCLFLTGSFDDACWQQDVGARVFASLGQPNWLAAYLEMLIFPALYFALTAKRLTQLITYLLLLVTYYMAFTFTYSRGATLGLIVGLVIFAVGLVSTNLKDIKKSDRIKSLLSALKWRPFLAVILLFVVVNLLYGSALTRFQLINPALPTIPASQQSSTTALETDNSTDSSQIRLIVWKGALDIFKHYPLFGSGVETFTYSYYKFEPKEHNLTSEWDFLYNKAHNEYLNYLATTGLFGFLSYMLMIGIFILYCGYLILNKKTPIDKLLVASILAGYISYLIQNFFQFSVVMIAVLFYIFPAFVFASMDKASFWPFPELRLSKKFLKPSTLRHDLSHRVYSKLIVIATILVALSFIFTLSKYWLADTLYAQGYNNTEAGNAGRGYNYLLDAVFLNPHESIYRSELGFAAASAALALADKDATLSGELKQRSVTEADLSLKESPANTQNWRTAIRTYYTLSSLDSSFNQKTLDTIDHTISLAPTDAKLYYNKALILSSLGKNNEAMGAVKQAIILKPNYRDAHFALGTFYQAEGQKDLAIQEYKTVLQIIPNDPEALDKLKALQ